MAQLIWLASYPKSGNTWFRALLTALETGESQTPDVNRLVGSMLTGWASVESVLGVTATELTQEELLRLRPLFIRDWAHALQADYAFLKSHDALETEPHHGELVPVDVTRGAVYFVRNPLDVCVSFAHHSGVTPHEMVKHINAPDMVMARPEHRLARQIPQPTGSWSRHVDSWTIAAPFPVHALRYEDLIAEPLDCVAKATRSMGLDYSRVAIEVAVEATSFSRLAEREQRDGFREKAPRSERFFRSGLVGSWRTELSAGDVRSIIDCHRETMTRFGYLDASGELLV